MTTASAITSGRLKKPRFPATGYGGSQGLEIAFASHGRALRAASNKKPRAMWGHGAGKETVVLPRGQSQTQRNPQKGRQWGA